MEQRYGTGVWNGCGPGACSGPPILTCPHIYIYMATSQNCVWNVPRCSGRMERRGFVTGLVPDLLSVMKYRLYINIYIYIICTIYNIYVKDMHVEATPHLHDILVVHLFNAGLPCMASARALDTTRPVASVTHWLPCEAVDSASDLSRRSHLLLLKLRGPMG